MVDRFFGREDELSFLQSFADDSKSGFMFVRGRRRIGKSWLLTEFSKRNSGFIFHGDADSSSGSLIKKFAEVWRAFSGDDSLSIIRSRDLNWLRAFKIMTEYFKERSTDTHIIILDEIQWIAKRRSGFLSQLKEVWIEWEKLGNVKVVLCGSSQRFFSQATASETSVLHRLRTIADLWIHPFSLSAIQKYYFPQWTEEQICMVFMITGGVPYYLERIPSNRNFIQAINKAFFTRNTIFIDEFKEVINLEFNKTSVKTAEKVMACLGQDGTTLENIRKKCAIKNESTVRTIINQLIEFRIVSEKSPAGHTKANRRGTKFYLRDPFLNFYFQILRNKAASIKKNKEANLFSSCITSKKGYYIEDFSGKAFELLTEWVLRQELSPHGREPILKALQLSLSTFKVGHYWEEGKTQVDLIIENLDDRESRLIELKWLSSKTNITDNYLEEIRNKTYSPPKGWTISYSLLISQDVPKPLLKKASNKNIVVLGLNDLF